VIRTTEVWRRANVPWVARDEVQAQENLIKA